MTKSPSKKDETPRILSVRQPWAWLIIHGGKDIENRTWETKYTGPVVIHASKKPPAKRQLELDRTRLRQKRGIHLPDTFETGGVVGIVELDECVVKSNSFWFQKGFIGWKLKNPRPVKFIALKGRLGLSRTPPALIKKLKILKSKQPIKRAQSRP